MRRLIATAAIALLATGCVSAADRSQPERSATDAGASVAAQRCPLYTPEQLAAVLGKAFQAPIVDPSSDPTATQCQWTATDQAALVLTKVVTEQAGLVFRTSLRAAQRSLGLVARAEIPGARAAYSVPRLGRVGMLVGDRYVEISVLVPDATPEQITRLATAAAAATKPPRR